MQWHLELAIIWQIFKNARHIYLCITLNTYINLKIVHQPWKTKNKYPKYTLNTLKSKYPKLIFQERIKKLLQLYVKKLFSFTNLTMQTFPRKSKTKHFCRKIF